MRTRLTVKQEKFCVNYFTMGNATQAAIAAGYSPKTAKVIASETLTLPYVKARIEQLQAKTTTNAIADVTERRERLTKFIRANLSDFVGEHGDVKPLQAAGSEALSEYSFTIGKNGINKSIKLRDPIAAIDLLNKMDKIYTDNTVTNNVKVETMVFVLPDGTKLQANQLAPQPQRNLIDAEAEDDNGNAP